MTRKGEGNSRRGSRRPGTRGYRGTREVRRPGVEPPNARVQGLERLLHAREPVPPVRSARLRPRGATRGAGMRRSALPDACREGRPQPNPAALSLRTSSGRPRRASHRRVHRCDDTAPGDPSLARPIDVSNFGARSSLPHAERPAGLARHLDGADDAARVAQVDVDSTSPGGRRAVP